MAHPTALPDSIQAAIVNLRGQNVMLDADLATLYGVPTKVLNQAVARNRQRFPADFVFRLAPTEVHNLRSQIVTSRIHGGRRSLPYAFTEQGVAMLSSVLRSPRAIAVNIEIVRSFVQLRRLLDSNRELAAKLAALEKHYDAKFRIVFDAIRELMSGPLKPGRRIGYRTGESNG